MNNFQGQYGNDKQKDSFQGRYGEDQQNKLRMSWVCPNCETNNTGLCCALCGYTKVKSVHLKSKPIKWIAAIVTLVFLGIVVVFWGSSNSRKYNRASQLLLQGQFDEAISLFAELEGYKDSRVMCTEAYYVWAEALLEENKYDDALNKLDQIPEYEKTSDLKLEVQYQKAKNLYQRSYGTFKLAYLEFDQISGYKDSDELKSDVVVDWATRIVQTDSLQDAETFIETIPQLSDDESRKIYEFIIMEDYYTSVPESGGGMLGVGLSRDFEVNSLLLEVLSGELPYKNELQLLFGIDDLELSGYIYENKENLRKMWVEIPIIREVIVDSGNIDTWLWGRWVNDAGMYIHFKGNETNYNLPADKKPEEVTNYFITLSHEFEWVKYDGYDNRVLQKPFRINLVGPDTIEVYCYSNDETYTLYRSK